MKPRIVTARAGQVECELHENFPLRVVGAGGRRVHCLSGVIWITAYDHPDDVFLRPGEVFVIPNDRLVLAEAVGRGRMAIDLPAAFDRGGYRGDGRVDRRGMAGLLRAARALLGLRPAPMLAE